MNDPDREPRRGDPCPRCSEPHPKHLGWCPRWEWKEGGDDNDVDGDFGGAQLDGKLDTGLRPDWQDPHPDPEPGAPDDFASNEPTDEANEECGCPPSRYSVARGRCMGCGRTGPPPRCRCVDCTMYGQQDHDDTRCRCSDCAAPMQVNCRCEPPTHHEFPSLWPGDAADMAARQYVRDPFSSPIFNRFMYTTLIDVEEIEED